MSFPVTQAAICFIACHVGPARHFATISQNLPQDSVEIYAFGPAVKTFKDLQITVKTPFSIDSISPEEEDALTTQLAKNCSVYSAVITDVGHCFDAKIQKALADHAKPVRRFAYYDNPEPCVPGGYSKIAREVMLAANGVLFANSNLAKSAVFEEPDREIAFKDIEKIGIGYYPLRQAEKIATRRIEEQASMRNLLLLRYDLTERKQKIFTYFGGNNDEYFDKAFPAFLSLLVEGIQYFDFSNIVFVLQQHPGAKEKNLDANMVLDWIQTYGATKNAPKIVISNFSSDDIQIATDCAFYYQTSMAAQFVLEDIPTAQIGHNTFQDILIRSNLSPSITDVHQFIHVLTKLIVSQEKIPKKVILESLGIKENWLQIFKNSVEFNSEAMQKSIAIHNTQEKKTTWHYYLTGATAIFISLLAIGVFKHGHST